MLVGCKTAKAGKDCGEAPYKEDKGQFAYQAGPVRVKSRKRCVWARGYVGAPHDKPLFMAQTDGKYRGRYCGWLAPDLDIPSLAGGERRR